MQSAKSHFGFAAVYQWSKLVSAQNIRGELAIDTIRMQNNEKWEQETSSN